MRFCLIEGFQHSNSLLFLCKHNQMQCLLCGHGRVGRGLAELCQAAVILAAAVGHSSAYYRCMDRLGWLSWTGGLARAGFPQLLGLGLELAYCHSQSKSQSQVQSQGTRQSTAHRWGCGKVIDADRHEQLGPIM